MRLTRRSTLAAATLGVGSLALPRFAIGQSDNRPHIRVAVQSISNSGTLDPLREQSSNVCERWVGSILEKLIERNQQRGLRRVAGLATATGWVDDMRMDVVLRPGVVMHDGRTMTAEDVAFSFGPERMFGGATASQLPADIPAVARRHFPALAGVEILDNLRVRFNLTVPDPTLPGRLSAGGAEIVSQHAWMERGTWAANNKLPVGTGPYRVVNFRPDDKLELEAHDAYWGGRPPFKSVTFFEVPELAARISGLQAGEFNFACDISPDQISTIERDSRMVVAGGLVPNHRILAFDKTQQPLADPRVRLAMAHAIDGQAIVNALWAGRSRVPQGLQWEFYGDMFIDDWQSPPYDVLRARDLLHQAGYRGQPIIYRARNDYYTAEVDTAQLLIEFWRQVGLNVHLEIKENWSQVLDKAGPRGVRDWSNSATFDDPVSSIVAQHGPHGAQQANGEWTNPEMNDLCVILERNSDVALRRKVFARILDICEREDPAYAVLHQNANFTAVPRAMRWQATPSFFLDLSSRAWHV